MHELIELIQSGDINNNQILHRVATAHNQNCDELDEAMNQIEALEGKDTLNQLVILELKEKLTKAVDKCALLRKEADVNKSKAVEMAHLAQDFQNKLAVKQLQVSEIKQVKAEMKKLRPQVKRLKKANTNATKRNIRHLQEKKDLKLARDKALLECAKLTMTGYKKVGKYVFSIFPVKVVTEEAEGRIGLMVKDNQGCMKVLTRTNTGELVQPKSHHFRFNQEEADYIDQVFTLIEKGNHVFTNELLKFVK